jgi:glycosyltransferase involved in cell wall biosynthesis
MSIAVVIPTRNRTKLLARALASVDEGLDVVVIDDASNPYTRANNQKFTENISGVYIYNEVHWGAAKSRNLAAVKVNSDWLCFLDDDDQLVGGFFAAVLKQVDAHPEVGAWVPNVVGGVKRCSYPVSLDDTRVRNQVGGCSGLLIRKELFEDLGGFDEAFESMQDWDLWIRLILRNSLYYSGVTSVIYDSASEEKITHDLKAKYLGLRRLYFKHYQVCSEAIRKQHLVRLWALRQLIDSAGPRWFACLRRVLVWPAASGYYLKWRKYLKEPQSY